MLRKKNFLDRKNSKPMSKKEEQDQAKPQGNQINIELNSYDKPASIQVYSIHGEVVHSCAITGSANYSIDTSHLSKGLYFLRLTGESGSLQFSSKVIKE